VEGAVELVVFAEALFVLPVLIIKSINPINIETKLLERDQKDTYRSLQRYAGQFYPLLDLIKHA